VVDLNSSEANKTSADILNMKMYKSAVPNVRYWNNSEKRYYIGTEDGGVKVDTATSPEITHVQEYIATEDITAGDVVSMLKNGEIIVGSDDGGSINIGTESVFNAGSIENVSSIVIDETHFIVAYADPNDSGKGKAILGSINGDSISFGNEYIFNNGNTSYTKAIKLDENRFVVSYRDNGSSDYGRSIVGTISNDTIAFGNEYRFNNAQTSPSTSLQLDNSRFIVTYKDGGNSGNGTAIIGTVTGTAISFGNEYVFNNGNTSFTSSVKVDNNLFVITYKDSAHLGYGTATVGTITGTSISFGNEYVFNPGTTNHLSSIKKDQNNLIITYKDGDNSGYGTATVGTIAGNAISFSDEYVFNYGTTDYIVSELIDDERFIISYRDHDNSGHGTAIVGFVNNNAIHFGNKYVFNEGSTNHIATSSIDSTHFIISYRDDANNYYGTSIAINVSPYAPSIYIGIANETKATGESVPVTIAGISNTLSGLIPNQDYYADDEGVLSTNASGIKIGTAISDSILNIDID
jgi:hypothetical protein